MKNLRKHHPVTLMEITKESVIPVKLTNELSKEKEKLEKTKKYS